MKSRALKDREDGYKQPAGSSEQNSQKTYKKFYVQFYSHSVLSIIQIYKCNNTIHITIEIKGKGSLAKHKFGKFNPT